MRKEIHIVSNPNRGGWDAKRPNADRASKHFDTKKEALEWSRDLAKREGLELIPHGTDGKIQNHERSKDVLGIVCSYWQFSVFMEFCFSPPAWLSCIPVRMS